MTEFGHRPYVSDLTLFQQLRNPTFHGVSSRMKMPESELAQPYMNDGTYSEMEHWMPRISGWPHFPIAGSIPDGPWINPLPTPWHITCYAWTDDCYNDGEENTITVHTTFPIIHIHSNSAGVSDIGFEKPDQLKFTVAEGYTSHIYFIFVLKVPPNDLGLPDGATCEATCVVYPCSGCGQYDNEITFQTQAMVVDATNTLGVDGTWNDCFSWELTSGGGSLGSTAENGDVVYTAPSTNPECANNALITLLKEGVSYKTLEIAINAQLNTAIAFSYCMTPCDGAPAYPTCLGYFDCDSWRHTGGTSDVFCKNLPGQSPSWYPKYYVRSFWQTCVQLGFSGDFTYKDARTAQMKTDGCCPRQLL